MLCVVLQKSPGHQRGSGCAGDEVGGAEGRCGKHTESQKGVNRATIRYPQEVLDGRHTFLCPTIGWPFKFQVCVCTHREAETSSCKRTF